MGSERPTTAGEHDDITVSKRSFAACYRLTSGLKGEKHISRLSSALAERLVSIRASIRALNYPLFDGDVSEEARRMLAHGDVSGAMQEYSRLAALGSGRARCIMAYGYLVGSTLTPRDLVVAKSFALSATASEPGFSNYILGFIALADGNYTSSFANFLASRKAGFLPAFSASAQLFSDLYRSAERDLRLSENLFKRAIRVGHTPAYMLLAVFYMRGNRGLIKRVAGIALYPIALIAFYFAWRFSIFSISTFTYHPTYRNLLKEPR